MTKSGGLGKGLDLIFMQNNTETENAPVTLNISELEANLSQPRFKFKEDALSELANSIAEHGLIQPIVVKPLASGKYKIIAGERRFRASKIVGLSEVPVVVKDIDDSKIMELALVENLQREDLSALEEAKGYKALMDAHNFTQEDVSKAMGKSRSYIANALRLLNLPSLVIEKLESGEITAAHARTLASLNSSEDIECALNITLSQGLNVRQLERLVKKMNLKKIEKPKSVKLIEKEAFFKRVETELNKKFSRKVKVVSGVRKKGTIQIEFYGEEDLSKFYKILMDEK